MFHTVRNIAKYGTVAGRSAADAVRERLPPGWSVELRAGSNGQELLTLRASDGRHAKLEVVSRKRSTPQDIALLMQRADGRDRLLLVAPFLSPRARELLAEANASYVDRTGNLRVVAHNPAIFLEVRGADRNPDRQPRALRSLKGAAAGRVVRALCDFMPPYGVRTLATASTTPLGTVSRVVSLLEEEALVTRDDKKLVTSVDWPRLIKRWAGDYNVTGSNTMTSYLEPRGLSALAPKLDKLDRYAVTGSLASRDIAPPRLAMIYVDDAKRAAQTLDLVPTETGANVWLLEPFDDVVFERVQTISMGSVSVIAAALSQVAADLMTSPGRGPQEAEALIEKAKGSEHAWRKRP